MNDIERLAELITSMGFRDTIAVAEGLSDLMAIGFQTDPNIIGDPTEWAHLLHSWAEANLPTDGEKRR